MSKKKANAPGELSNGNKPRPRSEDVRAWIAEFRAPLDAEFPDPAKRLLHLAGRWNVTIPWELWKRNLQSWDKAKEHLSDAYRLRSKERERQEAGEPADQGRLAMYERFVVQEAEQEQRARYEFWRYEFEQRELYGLLARLRPDLLEHFGPPVCLNETIPLNERAEKVNRVWAKLLTAELPPPVKKAKPGLRPTDAERKKVVLKLVKELPKDTSGHHASVKKIIKELVARNYKQRPQKTREILRELKDEKK